MKNKVSKEEIKGKFEEMASKVKEEDVERVIKESQNIIEKAKKSSILGKEIAKIELLINAVKDYWNGKYTELPKRTLIATVVALIYILSPIDLIPDFIPVVGLIDDLTMLLFVWEMISRDIKEYAEWKIKNEKNLEEKEKIQELYIEAFGTSHTA